MLPASSKEIASWFPKEQRCHHFSIAEIQSATKNFNENLLIGRGGFGTVFKGVVKDGTGTVVAVKRHISSSDQGLLEFQTEVEILSMLRHRNIVHLIGYCYNVKEMILVYEYMPNGTLRDHLHMHCTPLSWSQRLKICIDVARALDYLHNGTVWQGIIHRDVKSSHILLDNQWTAKITDFALSKIIPSDSPLADVNTTVTGTMGYLDPEYFLTGQLSKKSDVYSFGVILLEVLCRRCPLYTSVDVEKPGLVGWAKDCMSKGKLKQIIDPDLRGQISLRWLKDYAKIAEDCLHRRYEQRITMAEVVVRLEYILASKEMTRNLNPKRGISAPARGLTKHFVFSGHSPGGSFFKKAREVISGASYQVEKDLKHNEELDPASEPSLEVTDEVLLSMSDTDAISEASYHLQDNLKHNEEELDPSHEVINEGFGSMSEMDAISEASYQLEKIPRHWEFNSPSESHPEVVDEGLVLSRNEGESSHDFTLSNYLQRALVFMWKRDLLHLISFYPVKKEAEEVNFGSLITELSSLNKYIRMSLDYPKYGDYRMEIQTLVQDIEEQLHDAAFDMVAYLPQNMVLQNRSGSVDLENLITGANSGQVPSAKFWSGIPEIHASVVASATHRALRCVKDLKVKELGISGSDAEEVAEALKDLPELASAFDMVLSVHIKHHRIEELMNDIEEEIRLWKKRSSETGNNLKCLLFIDCTDAVVDLHVPEFKLSKWFGTVQIVMTNIPQNAYCPVDMDIRIEDHLLPWILFSTNADLATTDKYSGIQQMAARLVKECHGHLLAIILLAKALRGEVDISAWELALQELTLQQEPSSSQPGITSNVIVRVLKFIWSHKDTVSQRCIMQFASRYSGSEFEISSLINNWIRDGLVKNEQEGQLAFEDLIHSFLLERVGENCVRMRDETRVTLVAHFSNRAHELYLMRDGSETSKTPNLEEWDAREIHLTNNVVSELPENPSCPILVKLFLHSNQDLMDIPIAFFANMPSLQVLDLSSTSITGLPFSISELTTLRKLSIRNCDLMMELPPEIGALKNLKVFDSEGTRLICLPEEFGLLTKLECLKVSLYNFTDTRMQIIPAVLLSKLVRLKELRICVDSYSKWWEDEVKLIIDNLSRLRNLEAFRLYFPTAELLHRFMDTKNWEGVPIYQHLSNFGFVVGHLQQRLVSRLPLDLDETFVKLPKCLKFTNVEGYLGVIFRALKHANALFLDRHWTIQSFSTFAIADLEKMKFCLLSECNEMLHIIDGNCFDMEGGNKNVDSSVGPVLGSLQYLSIHYLKSLFCIWYGPIQIGCLSNLKVLAMHACPELTTILTRGLLDNLTRLEYLIVEDCPKIYSLISLESYQCSTSTHFLPSLKKISLLHLPQFVSISLGTSIGPRLESLVVYDCPNLKKLSNSEVSDHIKEIKGENEWWDALKWCEPEWTGGQPEYVASVFIPLGIDGDIMDELADVANVLPHLSD